MKRAYLVVVTLVAVSLACSVPVNPPSVSGMFTAVATTTEPTATMLAPTPTAATGQTWTAEVQLPTVNIRVRPDGAPKSYLTAGDQVTILYCTGDWCRISRPVWGFVWRGCLSDNPKKLGCEAR